MVDRSTVVQPFTANELRESVASQPLSSIREAPVAASKRVSVVMGSGRGSSQGTQEMASMVKHAQKTNALEAKAGEMRLALFATFLLLALSVIFNGIAVFVVVQKSKENHTVDGALVDLEGKVVEVGRIESLGQLFDMPYLSIETLKTLESITVILPGNKEHSFRVEMVEKMCSGNSVILYTPQGNSININGYTKAALVSFDGEVHQIQGSERRRQLTAGRPVQLYSKEDFFVLSNGWDGSRRLSLEEDGAEGWANFALSAEDAMMTTASDANFCVGQPYFGIGKATVEKGTVEVDMLYLNDASLGDRSMYLQAEDKTVLFADCSDNKKSETCRITGSYLWNTLPGNNDLQQCNDYTVFARPDSESNDTTRVQANLGAEDEDVDIQMGDSLVFEGKPCKELLAKYPKFPTLSECKAVNDVVAAAQARRLKEMSPAERLEEHYGEAAAADAEHPDEGRRRLGNAFSLTSDSYSRGECSGSACVLVENCAFAFRGSDDVQDWLSNAAHILQWWIGPVNNWHGGFHAEFQKIRPVIEARVNACGNPVFVGHSLGGAMATVAQDYYNKGSVVTFGAPLTFDNNPGCFVPGKRIFHEEDPVAGNLFGVMSSFYHGTSGIEIYTNCFSRNWLGWCTDSRTTTRDVGCQKDSGWFDVNVGAHTLTGAYKNHYQSQNFW